MYYVIALGLYSEVAYREVLRCLLEGLQWLQGEHPEPRVVAPSSITQARERLGWEVVQQLHDAVVKPIATEATRGAWYRQWRLVGPYLTSELALAEDVLPLLKPAMLCLADRGFYSFRTWGIARETGADLVWRIKKSMVLPREKELVDGSYLSRIYESQNDQKRKQAGVVVRVVDYTLAGVRDAEPIYRLITTILDPEQAPAIELAALYHERWEIETAFDELKTHLRAGKLTLRSKTPDLIRQEFYGLLMAHFAIRGLMHEAAMVRELLEERVTPAPFRQNPRAVRRRAKHWPTVKRSRPGTVPRAELSIEIRRVPWVNRQAKNP